jgi:fluoride exporter
MVRLLAICAAGALGTATRYGVGIGAARAFGAEFPYGTFAVNILGSFLIGLVFEVAPRMGLSQTAVLTIVTGFLGGFTTYSAFNEETFRYLSAGRHSMALAYAGATIVVCLVAGALGHGAGRLVVG